MTFNYIDLILIFILSLNVANGYRRGLVHGSLELISWISGIIFAFVFYQPFSKLLESQTDLSQTWTVPLAFLLIIILTGTLMQILSSLILKYASVDFREMRFNRVLGVFPGIVNGAALVCIISSLLFILPVSNDFDQSVRESFLADSLATQTESFESAVRPIFEDALNETLTRRLTTYPGSDEMVELPFRVTDFKPRPDLEAEMLELVNKERAAEGSSPVKADDEMRDVARKHSADMFRRGYFSHNTPEDKSPFDRMEKDKVRFQTAGENLAIAPTLKIAHTGLMNSPGHRANILQPKFGRLGIGILDGGRRGLMITQNFRN